MSQDPSIRGVLGNVHYPEFSTVYPTASQAVFAAVAWLTPDGSGLAMRRFLMKLVLVLFDCGVLYLVIHWLRFVGRPVGYAALYGWCPLVIKEFANSGHLDSIAVFFSVAAVYCVTRAVAGRMAATDETMGRQFRLNRMWAVASVVLLGVGVGAKLYPMVLAPLVFMQVKRSCGWRCALIASLVFAVTVGVLLAPTLGHRSRGSDAALAQAASSQSEGDGSRSAETQSSPSGFVAFFRYWEMNDFLFMLVVENLKPHQSTMEARNIWFAVTPDPFRRFLTKSVSDWTGLDAREAAFLMTRVVTSLICLGIALWLIRTTKPTDSGSEIGKMAFYTVAWFWLLLPTQNPWYWIWAVAFLPFVDRRIWWWMSGCVLLYYLRFWLDYHYANDEIFGSGLRGAAFFDFVITWLEYGPWFVLLGMGALIRFRRRGGR